MERSQTPMLSSITPPLSPTGLGSPGGLRSGQSFMESPYSRHSIELSPNMRSPQLQSPRPQSPQLRSPTLQRGEEELAPPSKPRLVIRKLVLINYKSYAGRQEIGPFNQSFTAVVGPNGSGKSNVIDSLLFVFGFRAKKMRQDKLTGLIHNSEQHPNLPFARVEVHFANVGIPNSDLVLAREVRRDGGSFYSLNDTRCSYSEISSLLEEKGIDLRHKRFLILQGEVESIALMPPKAENEGDDGLLEYLEDIIGTSNYKSRIAEVEEEVEVLRQDCGEKQRRVDIVSKDLKKLDVERAENEKLMLNQNRGMIARSSLWQLHSSKASDAIKFVTQDMQALKESLDEALGSMGEKRQQLSTLENQAGQESGEATRAKKELASVTAQLKDAQLKQARLKQRQDQFAAGLKKAERNLKHAKNEHDLAETWLNNFDKDEAQLRKKLQSVTELETIERKKLEEMQAELHLSTKDLHDELESLQIQAEPWREKISVRQQELASVLAEHAEARQKLELAQKREQECRTEAERVISDGHAAQLRTRSLQKKYEKISNEQKAIEAELPETEAKKETMSQEIAQLRSEVRLAQEARDASHSQNMLEKELMSMKIPGLFGRLGSLGSIDDKYDIAVSTAGPELNNFVVDTVETAKRCIEELRKRSIGRAKFMVLSKLQPLKKESPQRFPAPRLIDLITPMDQLFMKAFASVLGDTMVVATSDEANKVSFSGTGRHRVVTLDGMLINSSGQMSGGGTPHRGFMAKTLATVSPEELEGLEKKLAATELDFADIRQRLSTLQARQEELNASASETQITLEKEKMSLKELENNMQHIRELRRKYHADVEAQQATESGIASKSADRQRYIQQEKENLESQSKSIESAIQSIQEKILSAGGLIFREQSTKVTDLQKEEVEIQRRLEDGQEKLAQERSRVSKLKAEISRYEKEINNVPADTSAGEIPDIRALEVKVQQLSAVLDSHLTGVEEAKNAAAVVRAEIEELRASQVETQNKLEKLNHSLSEHKKRLDSIDHKLKSLKLHDMSMARKLDTSPVESSDTPSTSVPSTNAQADPSNDVLMKIESTDPDDLLPELSPDELNDLDENELRAEIAAADEACAGLRYSQPDFEALERYRTRYTEYVERKAVGDEALVKFERTSEEVQRLKKRRYKEFMDGFLQISSKLKEMYQLITMGGNAELELVDTMDPFAEGILFSVMPPKKSWRNIANLSGGEKTLSSLALVFALHHYKPTPLYVMDEIDAALDFRNVSIIANYIKERTKDGQFIVISLRNNMFELASRLVGVYKVNNMTRSVTLQTE